MPARTAPVEEPSIITGKATMPARTAPVEEPSIITGKATMPARTAPVEEPSIITGKATMPARSLLGGCPTTGFACEATAIVRGRDPDDAPEMVT
jgi:hypothetical protein